MARSTGSQVEELTARGLQALRSLSVEFISFMTEEVLQGQTLERIIASFTRHQTRIISGVLGSVGIAGGTWAAVSLWTGSLGLWGALGYTLGLVTMPVWVPLAGGVAGLTAAGGAVYGVLNLARSRQQTRKLRCIIGFSKALMGGEALDEGDLRELRANLEQQKVDERRVEALLQTSAAQARELAGGLSADDALEVARYLYPLVYADGGVITSTARGRFRRICVDLALDADATRRIAIEYRERLDRQWQFLEGVIRRLNVFASALSLDRAEMELLREQLARLMRFDPRRTSERQRDRLLQLVSGRDRDTRSDLSEGELVDEVEVMAAYALAQTVAPETESRQRLRAAFDELVAANPKLSAAYGARLKGSRKKVEELYRATRDRIRSIERREGKA